jgi:hypothetical protein
MAGTVHVLRLSGLDGCEAMESAGALLTDRSVPDLSNLLVIDDTAVLVQHASAFAELLTSRRLSHLLCVAIGPASRGDRLISLPGNISGGQGSAVIWVGDPLGVDWQLATTANAMMRPDGELSGLHHLIEVLSAPEVFNRVREVMAGLPDGIASPGLKLDQASEMSSDFPTALATAIRKIIDPQTGQIGQKGLAEPLNGAFTTTAALAPNGRLGRARLRCQAEADAAAAAVDDVARLGTLAGTIQTFADARDQVTVLGEALRDFRDQVSGLFEVAHAPGGLTERQARRVSESGVQLKSQVQAPQADTADRADGQAPTDPVTRSAVDAVTAGEVLPVIAEQLALAERSLTPRGSRSYLPELEKRCPAALIGRLLLPPAMPDPQPWLPAVGAIAAGLAAADGIVGIATGIMVALAWTGLVALSAGPRSGSALGQIRMALAANLAAGLAGVAIGAAASRSAGITGPLSLTGIAVAVAVMIAAITASWRARAAVWQRSAAPAEAVSAAGLIADLVIMVAGREWAADTATVESVARTKITVEAIGDELTEYADRAGEPGPESSRLAASLEPTLRNLVVSVLLARPAAGHSDGQAAYRRVRSTTEELLRHWDATAKDRGPLAKPSFASSSDDEDTRAEPEDLSLITLAANADPDGVMWQLCAPADLTMLDVQGPKGVVTFAPAMSESVLSSVLPMDTVWTSSGQYAGLLRLVTLRPGSVLVDWSGSEEPEPAQ